MYSLPTPLLALSGSEPLFLLLVFAGISARLRFPCGGLQFLLKAGSQVLQDFRAHVPRSFSMELDSIGLDHNRFIYLSAGIYYTPYYVLFLSLSKAVCNTFFNSVLRTIHSTISLLPLGCTRNDSPTVHHNYVGP